MSLHFGLILALLYHFSATWWLMTGTTASPTNRDGQIRIIGGKASRPDAWPFTAAILDRDKALLCGGVIWNQNTILTAAHCATRGYVYLGHTDLSQLDPNFLFEIKEFKLHEGFDMVKSVMHPDVNDAFYNDIALVHLNRSIDFKNSHSSVSCVCDPEPLHLLDTTKCVTMGWGITNLTSISEGIWQMSKFLKELKVSLQDDKFCASKSLQYNGKMHVCARGPQSTAVFKGDSGGPLVCPLAGKPSQYSIVGVTSFVKWKVITSADDWVTYYIAVVKYLDWINETVKQLEPKQTKQLGWSQKIWSVFSWMLG